jgi:hypothetical protein
MKAKINDIEFEGTPQEFAELLASQNKNSNVKSTALSVESVSNNQVEKDTKKYTRATNPSQNTSYSKESYLPGTTEFVTSLFRYKPSKTTMGRQSYVVQMLATGKTYTIRTLATKANTDIATVVAAIRRSVAADCIVQVNNPSTVPADELNPDTKVRLISLGTIERALQVKEEYHRQHAESIAKKSTKNEVKHVHTGSAPITKILYNENN